MLVDADGHRFGNESLGYSGYARIVRSHGEGAFAVFDQRIFDIAAQEEEFLELWRMGGLKKVDTIGEAAVAFGLDASALAQTIETYNAAAGDGAEDGFDRHDFGLAPLRPPFYIARTVPGLFHTQGGLRVDGDARVLRPDGTKVANLFAGGGAAAGISGRSGALGYASGNGLLAAIGLGRLAGLAAAREIAGEAA
ncbi:MAG: FAD-binding protein [Acetobacteraceae bacterium]